MSQYFDSKSSFLEPNVKQYGSHVVMTNVTKPIKTSFINVDTKYRDEANYDVSYTGLLKDTVHHTANYYKISGLTYSTDIRYNTYTACNVTLPEKINCVKTMQLVGAEIPIMFYNFSMNIGNIFFQFVNYGTNPPTTKMVQIDENEYDMTTLIAAVQAKFTSLSIPLQITLVNNHAVITSTANHVGIRFDVTPEGNAEKLNLRRKLGWFLGFRKTNYAIPNSGSSITSDGIVDINGVRYAYLLMDEFSKNSTNGFIANTNFINKNILAKISFNKCLYPFSSVQHASIENGYLLSDTRSYGGKIDFQKFNVQLVDEFGTPIDLNGGDFSFSLKVEHE